jgi:hypothetical protein
MVDAWHICRGHDRDDAFEEVHRPLFVHSRDDGARQLEPIGPCFKHGGGHGTLVAPIRHHLPAQAKGQTDIGFEGGDEVDDGLDLEERVSG